MRRDYENLLLEWITNTSYRKPLVLRGARQVGKTWLVRKLAEQSGKELVEINFERDPTAINCFKSNNPVEIIRELSFFVNKSLNAEKTLLFLDEIQAAGSVLSKLRWFYELMPSVAIIAAGSLLEFTLSDHQFSMPVGRIQFLHIEPMSFIEFLFAHRQELISDALISWEPGAEFSPSLHAESSRWFERYMMTGGMPEVVKCDCNEHNDSHCRELQLDLLATYRADFAKYRNKLKIDIFDSALSTIGFSLGKKFVYSHIDEGIKQYHAKKAVELLSLARVCHIIKYSAANWLPLGGEVKDTFRKIILNDIGLLHALLKTPSAPGFPNWERLSVQVRSQLAEQITGQQLRLNGPLVGDGPEFYYWQREGGRPGEIDYLFQAYNTIVPIELKSGTAGAMKSLHQFMFDKKLNFAIRIDQNPPSEMDVNVKTTQGDEVRYKLYSIPLYLTGMINRVVKRALEV